MADDAFSFHWKETLVAAMMHRLKPAEPGPDSICINRETFNRLLAIAETANAANHPLLGEGVRVSHDGSGSYISTLESPIVGSFTAIESSFLKSILRVSGALSAKLEERIA